MTLITCLPNESKEILLRNKIITSTSTLKKPPIFNYASFCLTKDNLPVSSISVFLIGYVTEQVQDDDNLFKSIKLTVSEFVGD